MLPTLPQPVQKILDKINATGASAYLVGGALRDLLRGAAPQDWDFATSMPPARLLQLFPRGRLIGGAFGTVQVPLLCENGRPFGTGLCEITPCRTEGEYKDGRHPGSVQFIPNILADLARRDFTINAMAYNGQVLIDPFGGQQDLQQKLLRCVGVPAQRFSEDALRVLRLFRFAAQLGFTAEWDTFCAANSAMQQIQLLPKERVWQELSLILLSSGPQVLSGVVAKGGLAAYGFTFAPALTALASVPKNLLCRLWAFIALCGASQQFVCTAFGFSQKSVTSLQECTRLYRLGPATSRTQLKQKLSKSKLGYAEIAAMFAAISPAYAIETAYYAEVCTNKEPYRLAQLAVTGDMLQYVGIRGQQCGRVLSELLAAVIKNPSLNRPETLLGLARGLQHIL